MKYRRIIFHHIPKTAGTFLLKQFPKATCRRVSLRKQKLWHPHFYLARDPRLFVACYPGKTFFSSHFAFEEYRPGRNEFKFTWIRHPVELFYSHLAHARNRTNVRISWKLPGYNEQCRRMKPQEFIDFRLGEQLPLFPMDYLNFPLQTFHFVGVTEFMDHSLEILSENLGISLKNDRPVNCSPAEDIDRTYRRDDLANALHREIAVYDECVQMLFSGSETASNAA